jgi:hypothetical protein
VLIVKKTTITMIIILASTFAGCATAVPVVDYYDTDADSLRRYQKIGVIDGAATNSNGRIQLGEVKGIFCRKSRGQISPDDHLAEVQAIDQVKLKAAILGADYITTPQCVISNEGDVTNNCFSSLICASSAVRD